MLLSLSLGWSQEALSTVAFSLGTLLLSHGKAQTGLADNEMRGPVTRMAWYSLNSKSGALHWLAPHSRCTPAIHRTAQLLEHSNIKGSQQKTCFLSCDRGRKTFWLTGHSSRERSALLSREITAYDWRTWGDKFVRSQLENILLTKWMICCQGL